MSALQNIPKRITEAEYLAFERDSDHKHELIDGEIVAMSGASERHNLISVSTGVALYTQLRGKSCKVYSSDMRVKVVLIGHYTYPDLSIVCGEARFSDEAFDTLTNPAVIIEVLSPSTERYDRGKKFQAYRTIESLRDYLLIAQDSALIEHYHRDDANPLVWTLSDARGLEAVITLESVGCVLTLSAVYEQIDFDTEAPSHHHP